MPEGSGRANPPKGLGRIIYRLPVWLYRIGLGGFLGNRFMLLTHTGRKSGLPRQTVLEVVRFDREGGVLVVASGFGEKSDWVRNIQVNPLVTVETRGIKQKAVARRLDRRETGDELVNYNQRHPAAMNALARLLGYRLDGSEEDIRRLGESLPMFSLTLFEP